MVDSSAVNAPFSNTEDVIATFARTGDKGDSGSSGTSGTSGSSGSSGTSGVIQLASEGENRIITSDGDGTGTAEANLTFDGANLRLTGSLFITGSSMGVDTHGSVSGSAQSTGSFGELIIDSNATIGGDITQNGDTFLIETSDTPTIKSLSGNPLVLDQRIPGNPGQIYNQLRFNSSFGAELRQFSTTLKLQNTVGNTTYWSFEQNKLEGTSTSTGSFGRVDPKSYGISGSSTSTGSFGRIQSVQILVIVI